MLLLSLSLLLEGRGFELRSERLGALVPVPERQDDGAGLSADAADAEDVDMEEVEQELEESSDSAAPGPPSSHAGELPVVKV
eukprot:s6801_g4.t1